MEKSAPDIAGGAIRKRAGVTDFGAISNSLSVQAIALPKVSRTSPRSTRECMDGPGQKEKQL